MAGRLDGFAILVVDDDYLLAHDTCRYLDAAGAAPCGPARDSAAAIALLRERAGGIDAVVVNVAATDGQLAHLIDAMERAGLPYILSAHMPPDDKRRCRLVEHSVHLTPFSGAGPADALHAALAGKAAAGSRRLFFHAGSCG